MWIQKLCCRSHSRDRDGGSRAWRVLLRGTWSEAVAHWGQVGISLIAWYRPHFTQDDPGDTLTLPLTPPWGWHWWFRLLLWEQWTYPPNFMAIVQIFVEIFKSRKWWKDWYCHCHVDSDWAKLNDINPGWTAHHVSWLARHLADCSGWLHQQHQFLFHSVVFTDGVWVEGLNETFICPQG